MNELDNLAKMLGRHREYRITFEASTQFGGLQLRWDLVGCRGGVHVWVRCHADGKTWYGGVEIHHRHPREDKPPSHTECELTGGWCWHDGSSSMADGLVEEMQHGSGIPHSLAIGLAIEAYRNNVALPTEEPTP